LEQHSPTCHHHPGGLAEIVFYRQEKDGHEPVYDWLKSLTAVDRHILATELKTLQMSFAVGMPMARRLNRRLWVLKVRLEKRVARIVFSRSRRRIVLLSASARLQPENAKRVSA